MDIDSRVLAVMAEQSYQPLFSTISGAHLYGFPSPDSDYDVRSVHVLPLPEVLGLEVENETVQITKIQDGLEVDLVSHDIKKFCTMLMKKNGAVLEQLYSPLIIHTTPEHEELKSVAKGCITYHHSHHYLGFADTQWKLFLKENPHRVKPLLYVYRVLLTGIYLMQTGKVEANLLHLNEVYKLQYIPELVERKLTGKEKSTLDDRDLAFYEQEYNRLFQQLKDESEKSSLPEMPTSRDALDDLLVRIRLAATVG